MSRYLGRPQYRRTTEELKRENTGAMVALLIGGPFTFGISWLALIFLLIVDGIDARSRKSKK